MHGIKSILPTVVVLLCMAIPSAVHAQVGVSVDNGKLRTSGTERIMQAKQDARTSHNWWKGRKARRQARREARQARKSDTTRIDSLGKHQVYRKVADTADDSLSRLEGYSKTKAFAKGDSTHRANTVVNIADDQLQPLDGYREGKGVYAQYLQDGDLDSADLQHATDRGIDKGKHLADGELSQFDEYVEGKAVLDQYGGYVSRDSVDVDGLADEVARETALATELEGGAVGPVEDFEKYNAKTQELEALTRNPLQAKRYGMEKLGRLANDNLTTAIPEVEAAQKKFRRLKKRMAWIRSSESFKDQPLAKRFTWGGNFQLVSFDPAAINLAPYLGFRINPKVTIGISSSYQVELHIRNRKLRFDPLSYSGRIYADYHLVKGFFAHVEYERTYDLAVDDAAEVSSPYAEAANIGFGREFGLPKGFRLHSIVLIDVLHDDFWQFPRSAFTFRIGIGK